MRTLDELIHYCNESHPVGALVLTGEWGCGKTYVVKRELTKALKDTHVIVTVSVFGMDSSKSLHQAIRQKWLDACLPVLGSLQKAREKGFFSAFSTALKKINPMAGGAADVVVSMNMVDLVTIKPEVEDFVTHKTKKVILVFDDVERSRMNTVELMGVINDYCENKKFNSIVIMNEDSILEEKEKDTSTYYMLREKTVAQTLYHIPDYNAVIHSILSHEKWRTPEYAEYLTEHENLIYETFISDQDKPAKQYIPDGDRKYHNFRTLIKGLQSFYRIYFHITEAGREVDDSHFYAFLAYYLVAKCGVCRGGQPCLETDDKTIREFYPRYSPESLTDAERYWINTGIWDGESFEKELSNLAQQHPGFIKAQAPASIN